MPPLTPHFEKILCDTETPVSLYQKLALTHDYAFLLESAEPHERIGRYSVIGIDPFSLHVCPAGGEQNPLGMLKMAYETITYTPHPGLPRIQAPFVGYFSYETVRHFEEISIPIDKNGIPESIFFLPKNLLIFDHFEHTIILIAYSKKDLSALSQKVKSILGAAAKNTNHISSSTTIQTIETKSQEKFQDIVLAAKEKICAGEIFQIVLSQQFEQKTLSHPFDLYRRLRFLSPSPYMYCLQYPDFSIIGSSPETLVRTEGQDVIIRPIAGTRRRGETKKEDMRLEEELKYDIKEQAEHMMLVDLGRNDVGRVAAEGSVQVTRLMEIEKYSHVMHLVSEVRGKQRKDVSLFDIFKTAFPAGTLTGAPKIRAMEIIAQLEQKPRGIYGGAVGYFDLSGNMDFAIAIRTMVYQNGTISLRAGAGIVYDSKPELEHKECCNKARGPLSAVL